MEGLKLKRCFVFLLAVLFSSTTFGEIIKYEKLPVKETSYQVEKEEISKEKDFDLGDLLFKSKPEISISRKGVFITEPFFRGFGRENINILIDGTRVYGACPNGMDTKSFFIRPFEIQGVSIKTVDLKNQGALGGTINIITKKPKKDRKLFELNLTTGSFNYNYIDFEVGLSNFWLGFGYIYSKPYETGEGKKITDYPTGMSAYQDKYKNKKAIDLKHTTLKLSFNNISFTASKFKAESVLYPYLKMDSLRDDNYRFNINYHLKDLLKINLYYFQMKHDMSDSYRVSAIAWTNGTLSTRGYMMRTYAESEVYGTNISTHLKKLTLGVETFIRKWNADNVLMMINNSGMIPDVKSFNFGIYGLYTKDLKNIKLKAGIRFDHVYSKANLQKMADNRNLFFIYYSKEKNKAEFNYLSGLLKATKPITKTSNISISLSNSVRFPSPQELFISLKRPMGKPNWIGNPYLKPTKNRQIEIKLNKKYSAGNVDFKLFYSDLKDYIYLNKIPNPIPAFSYKNIDAYIYGGSLEGFFVITDSISLSTGISYQIGRKKNGIDKDLAEIPPLKAMVSIIYEKDNLYVTVQDIYNYKQDKVDTELNETPTDSWNIVNIKLSYRKSFFDLTAGIDNLFDKFYYQHLSYLRNPFSTGIRVPEPGRFIYLKIGINL